MADLPVIQPNRMTVMIKPVGALCDLDCAYCYYLPTKGVFDGHEHRMTLPTLESFYAGVLPSLADEVTIAWQGGEPTLAGLKFFQKAIEFQEKYKRPTQRISQALQTNGTLLDEPWCRFLNEHKFLIGLSVDGPPRFHDHYRVTNSGKPSSKDVFRGLRELQRHKVEFNLLVVLNDINVHHPDEMLDYLLNLGTRWLQFIPAIEWAPDPADATRNILAPYSPDPKAYGKFLCRVFDRWFEGLRHRVSIREFDAVLNKLVLNEMPYCILDGMCHSQLTIEHDGAVFGCDHFVERRWQLGQIGDGGWKNNIRLDGTMDVGLTVHGKGWEKKPEHSGRDIAAEQDVPTDEVAAAAQTAAAAKKAAPSVDAQWFSRVDSQRLSTFAVRKQHLPAKCRACQWKPYCHGGCPKHRAHGGDLAEPTILCDAYMMFYEHAMPRMEWMASYFRKNQLPPEPPRKAAVAAHDGRKLPTRR